VLGAMLALTFEKFEALFARFCRQFDQLFEFFGIASILARERPEC
jgi:hypothetical protein